MTLTPDQRETDLRNDLDAMGRKAMKSHICNVCNKLFVDRMPRPDWMGCICMDCHQKRYLELKRLKRQAWANRLAEVAASHRKDIDG